MKLLKSHQLAGMCIVTTLLLAALSGCSGPTAGIDSPITVSDTEFQVFYADFNKRIASIGEFDKVLLVKAEVLSGDADPLGWEVWITDENGRKFHPGIKMWPGTAGPNDNPTIVWNFGVSKDSKSFTLHLPGDKTIVLDSLIGKEG